MTEVTRHRATYLPITNLYNLNIACRTLNEAFGTCCYLVGSSLTTQDYRDVDVRMILDDEEFLRLFPAATLRGDPFWSLICTSISMFLSHHSGLPIDFQVQYRTGANAEYSGSRHALGIT